MWRFSQRFLLVSGVTSMSSIPSYLLLLINMLQHVSALVLFPVGLWLCFVYLFSGCWGLFQFGTVKLESM